MGWLEDYLEYTKNQQSPTIYHYWVGITAISAALNRSVWLDRGDDGITFYQVFPGQLYMLLVGKSAKTKKSTAINLGVKIMKKAGIITFEGSGSPEGIVKNIYEETNKPRAQGTRMSMGTNAITTLVGSEASVVLGKQSYNEQMIDILTHLYDAPDDYSRTLSGKRFNLKNVCLTGIFGATPENIGDSFPAKVHTFGFLGRLHPVYSDDHRKINALSNIGKTAANDQKRIDAEKKYQSLIDRLRTYSTLHGSFEYTEEGEKWYNQWIEWWFSKDEHNLPGWPQRRPDHLLKLGMVLQVSNSTDMVLDEKVLERADRVLKEIEHNFHKCYEEVGQDKSAKKQQRILDVLTKGELPTMMLLASVRKFFKDGGEIQATLNTLQMSGEIQAYLKIPGNMNSQFWRIKK